MKLVFSTSDVHARDRLAYWREQATRATVAHEFDSHVGRAFQGRISVGTLGTLALSTIESDACAVRRTEHYIERASDDDLLLSLQLGGSLSLHQDGRDAIANLNDLFVLDPRRPFFVDVKSPMHALLIKVPRWELQSRLGDVRALTARPVSPNAPIAALASGFIAMLPKRVDALDVATGTKVAQQVLDLVALAFGAEQQGGKSALSSSRMSTLLRVKAVIEARLGEPGLRPAHAAAAAGISVRYANALLACEGTSLERFIMQRRLQHCRRTLEDAGQAFRTVSDIAYSFGFSDMSHFTRRFKAQFGCSPSTCRQRAITGPRTAAQGA
jgi:AraC-like DNA-binding protein